jgi:hypothetical protein
MAERQKINIGSRQVEVTEVGILERKGESVAEYRLEDGSIVRVATPITRIVRMEDSWDWEGKPIYLAIPGTSVTLVTVPDALIHKMDQ